MIYDSGPVDPFRHQKTVEYAANVTSAEARTLLDERETSHDQFSAVKIIENIIDNTKHSTKHVINKHDFIHSTKPWHPVVNLKTSLQSSIEKENAGPAANSRQISETKL